MCVCDSGGVMVVERRRNRSGQTKVKKQTKKGSKLVEKSKGITAKPLSTRSSSPPLSNNVNHGSRSPCDNSPLDLRTNCVEGKKCFPSSRTERK